MKANNNSLPIGSKYGYWTIISPCSRITKPTGKVVKLYTCHCLCGQESLIPEYSLKTGHSRSCGCMKPLLRVLTNKDKGLRGTIKAGNVYNRLTVVLPSEPFPSTTGAISWRVPCRCECGNSAYVEAYTLLSGHTRSCGCLVMEFSKTKFKYPDASWTKERLYRIWAGMKNRCHSQKNQAFFYYGGKGITVCDEWRKDYGAFRAWSMSNGYAEGLSIDRKDSAKDYCPGNCRWVTVSENSTNCSFAVFLTAFGETKSMSDWTRDPRCLVRLPALSHRINKMGMAPENAISLPPAGRDAASGKFALKRS